MASGKTHDVTTSLHIAKQMVHHLQALSCCLTSCRERSSFSHHYPTAPTKLTLSSSESVKESTDTEDSSTSEGEEVLGATEPHTGTVISGDEASVPSNDGKTFGSMNAVIVGRDGESFTIVDDSEEEQDEEEEENEQHMEEEQEVKVTSSLRSHLLARRLKSEDDFTGVSMKNCSCLQL